jgi:hypothetical protein
VSEPKITKVTILWEYENGEARGWELTDTPAVPLNISRTWSREPVRDYAAEAAAGGAWMMHKPGPITEVSVSVVAGAIEDLHRTPTPEGDDKP